MLRVVCFALLVSVAFASSHSEAPGTTKTPPSDITDLYAFRCYEPGKEAFTCLLWNIYPLQNPFGGPNYFSLSSDYFYELYIDNNGDAREDITFQFFFGSRMGGTPVSTDDLPDDDSCIGEIYFPGQTQNQGITVPVGGKQIRVPLKFVGPVTSTDQSALNWFEYWQMNLIRGDRTTGQVTRIPRLGSSTQFEFTKPFDYAGTKSFPDYDAYANQYIYNFQVPGCANAANARVFVGQRNDPFYINLGGIFDLINFVPIKGFPGAIKESNCNNDLRNLNTIEFALEVPTSCLVGNSEVIGVWVANRKLTHDIAGNHIPGTQVSRLGNPLVNEVVIGLRDKAKFTQARPVDDRFPPNEFQTYVLYPTMPFLINALFNGAVNSVLKPPTPIADIAPRVDPTNGRQDLFITYLTGIPGLNRPPNVIPAEMMRLNTSVPVTPFGQQNTMGVIAGDNAGFPNGRRPGDDVIDISLDVLMGRLCTLSIGCVPADAPVGSADLTDGAPIKDTNFQNKFPYFNSPIKGYPAFNDKACYPDPPVPPCNPVQVPVPVPGPPVNIPGTPIQPNVCPPCNCPAPVNLNCPNGNSGGNSQSGSTVLSGSVLLLACMMLIVAMF